MSQQLHRDQLNGVYRLKSSMLTYYFAITQ